MLPGNVLIYGSTGYTGKLIAQAAIRRGLRPILAGRDVEKVGQQAAVLGLEWRAFRLSDTRALERALKDTGLVLLVAGPYVRTSARVVEACLNTGAHYLDITGELDVYEALVQRDAQARQRGVMLGAGMGFDVVPTDCLAGYLKGKIPEANDLKLAFSGRGGFYSSHGTLKSGLEQMPQGIRVRRKGRLVQAALGEKSLVVDFGWGPRSCGLITWGDVVTAYWSTAIPNIEVYSPVNPGLQRLLKLADNARRAFGWDLTRRLAQMVINLRPDGASLAQREAAQMAIWGQVADPQGRRRAARLFTPEAYDFTADSAVRAVEKVLGGAIRPGFQTPATAFGADFVLELDGVSREDLPGENPPELSG
jgi:short subunit dehydrogenase-like uncharacterized protein